MTRIIFENIRVPMAGLFLVVVVIFGGDPFSSITFAALSKETQGKSSSSEQSLLNRAQQQLQDGNFSEAAACARTIIELCRQKKSLHSKAALEAIGLLRTCLAKENASLRLLTGNQKFSQQGELLANSPSAATQNNPRRAIQVSTVDASQSSTSENTRPVKIERIMPSTSKRQVVIQAVSAKTAT